ncbi:MAG: hypothetical protein JO051_01240 [Acidobacteriaceae bacterium]|nr:hypothetical protein [Acidobacteriaceae bacterium]
MPALLLTLLCVGELVLFLLPGLAVATIVLRKRACAGVEALIVTLAASATCGYIAFWIYFAGKTAGQLFSYGVVAASIGFLLYSFRRNYPRFFLNSDFAVPLAYTLCLGLFYLSLLYLFVNPLKAGVDVANVRFFWDTRAGDNIIPFIFAERIYDREPIRPFCCGDWLSGDRPPLQAGIFLLQRPLRLAGNTGLQYQVLGTMLQCLWVCGVWGLLRRLGANAWRITQVLGLLAFSGFLFYNSVYVWPKLLAATFVLFVFSILTRAVLTRFEVAIAATCFVLALLAHPGSVFSAPAILVLLIWRRNLITLRQAAAALLIIGAAIVPWTLYQHFYDPPGNRLLKMHLAGVIPVDTRSTMQALRDSYVHRSLPSLIENKWENVKTLVGKDPFPLSADTARVAQREYIWSAIGILNLGWIAALISLLRRHSARLPNAAVLIMAALINLLAWCMVMFGPAQTFTEHGSYADILLLSLGLIGFLLLAPRWVLIALIGLEAVNLVLVWVMFRPASFVLPTRAVVAPSLQWPMLMLAIIVGGAMFLYFARCLLLRESTSAVADALFEQQA